MNNARVSVQDPREWRQKAQIIPFPNICPGIEIRLVLAPALVLDVKACFSFLYQRPEMTCFLCTALLNICMGAGT
jgi:hypothetical protein